MLCQGRRLSRWTRARSDESGTASPGGSRAAAPARNRRTAGSGDEQVAGRPSARGIPHELVRDGARRRSTRCLQAELRDGVAEGKGLVLRDGIVDVRRSKRPFCPFRHPTRLWSSTRNGFAPLPRGTPMRVRFSEWWSSSYSTRTKGPLPTRFAGVVHSSPRLAAVRGPGRPSRAEHVREVLRAAEPDPSVRRRAPRRSRRPQSGTRPVSSSAYAPRRRRSPRVTARRRSRASP